MLTQVLLQYPKRLGLTISSVDTMHSMIDDLPGIGDWNLSVFNLEGHPKLRPHELYHRSLKDCVASLVGSPHLAPHMLWEPEKHFSTEDCAPGTQQYSEMNTGEWWWKTQIESPAGSTIIPLIFSTDKTMLTSHSGDKVAYPEGFYW